MDIEGIHRAPLEVSHEETWKYKYIYINIYEIFMLSTFAYSDIALDTSVSSTWQIFLFFTSLGNSLYFISYPNLIRMDHCHCAEICEISVLHIKDMLELCILTYTYS